MSSTEIDATGAEDPRIPQRQRLTPADRVWLKRELATGVQKSKLARKYDVSHQYITQFAKRYEREIAEIRENLDDKFAGFWIANLAARLEFYENEVEMSLNSKYATSPEQSIARQRAVRAGVEELGQLPSRQTITVIPVVHVIEGINIDDL